MEAKTFGRYQVRHEIGDGAMGRVYRGFDPLVRRTVAIKTVKSEYLTKDTREEYLRRFRREAQAAGSLSHHNIVGIFDVGEDYIVMEHVEGITLDGLLHHRTVLGLDAAMRMLVPLADALDYAHRAGVIHRDIKPGNIMVQPDGRPKLMDFGVARLETSIITADGVFFGSPSYMAPEQILSQEVTSRADIFAFAVVAYEVLTGSRPYRGDSITSIMYKVVNEPPPLPSAVNPALPARFDEVFARALAKQPAERFASAAEFVAALVGQEQLPDLAAWEPEPVPEAELASRMAAVETQALDASDLPVRPWGRLRRLLPAAAVLALVAEVVVLHRTRPRPGPPAAPLPAADADVPGVVTAVSVLRIETEPSGAVVWVDGRARGASPLSLAGLPAGPHRVRIVRGGYAPAELGLHLAEGTALPPLRFLLSPVAAADPPPAGPPPAAGVEPAVALLPRARSLPGTATRWHSGVIPPERVVGRQAAYPDSARRLRLSGTVTVEMTVTQAGEPKEVRVVESAGAILDAAVLAAVRTWRFKPAVKDGIPIAARWQFRHTFTSSG